MSRLSEYREALFDEFDDLINSIVNGGTPGAGATPTKTPSPSSRVAQIDGKWYVIDTDTGQTISPAYKTQSEATYAARYQYPPATPTPQPQPSEFSVPTSGSIKLANGQTYTPNKTAQDAFTSANSQQPMSVVDAHGNVSYEGIDPVGPNGRRASQVAGTPYQSPEEAAWYRALPTAVKAAAEQGTSIGGGGGGASPATGGGASAAAAKPVRAFPKTNVNTLLEWLALGRITQEEFLNEMHAAGYTDREINFLMEDYKTANPPQETAASAFFNTPSGLNPFDVPGRIKAGDFGSTTPQPINNAGLMLPNVAGANGGAGAIYATNPITGQPELAGYQINGNVYDPAEVAQLNQQRGLYLGNAGFDTQMGAVGTYNQLAAADQAMFPDATPSNINRSILDLFQPANPSHHPSVSDVENADNPLPVFQARGGVNIAGARDQLRPQLGQLRIGGPGSLRPPATQHHAETGVMHSTPADIYSTERAYEMAQASYAAMRAHRERERAAQKEWELAGGVGPRPKGWQPGMTTGFYNFANGGGFTTPGEVGMFAIDGQGNPKRLLAVTGEGPDGIGGQTAPERITVTPMTNNLASMLTPQEKQQRNAAIMRSMSGLRISA